MSNCYITTCIKSCSHDTAKHYNSDEAFIQEKSIASEFIEFYIGTTRFIMSVANARYNINRIIDKNKRMLFICKILISNIRTFNQHPICFNVDTCPRHMS